MPSPSDGRRGQATSTESSIKRWSSRPSGRLRLRPYERNCVLWRVDPPSRNHVIATRPAPRTREGWSRTTWTRYLKPVPSQIGIVAVLLHEPGAISKPFLRRSASQVSTRKRRECRTLAQRAYFFSGQGYTSSPGRDPGVAGRDRRRSGSGRDESGRHAVIGPSFEEFVIRHATTVIRRDLSGIVDGKSGPTHSEYRYTIARDIPTVTVIRERAGISCCPPGHRSTGEGVRSSRTLRGIRRCRLGFAATVPRRILRHLKATDRQANPRGSH